MSEWIKCSDRLPELDAGMSVDVWAFCGNEEGAYLEVWSTENSDEGEFVRFESTLEQYEMVAPKGGYDHEADITYIPPSRPTHWMRVDYPEPPTVEPKG